MESGDGLVNEFDEFFNTVYSSEIALLKSNFPKERSLNVKYTDLEKWNSDIADLLMKDPDKIINAAKEALEMHGFDKTYDYEVHVRFYELPDFNLLVQDLGAAHIDKLVRVEGILTKRYETKPKVKMALFKCKNCGANYKVIMTKQTQPMRMCEVCKKKVDFSEEESYFVDVQFAEMQELLERLRGGAPASHIQLMMEDDLVNFINPGEEITITGILRIKPPQKTQAQNENIYLKYLDVLKIDKSKKDFEQLEITEEEKDKIKELSKDPDILNKISRSFAPGIFGNDKIKEAITLQLFGGTPNKMLPGGAPIRDDMHLLLIGDPGAAKSRLLSYVHSVSPKSVYVSGKSVSGVGLCVDKNSLVVFENKGICKIKDYVENNFKNQKLIENANSEKHKVKILAANEKLKCGFVETNNIWKIKPSEYLYKIETRRGKYIKITPQTPLLVYRDNKVKWIKSSELNEKDLIATSKQISSFKKEKVSLISLIKSENVRINSPVSTLFNKISEKLIEKYGNLTEASKKIGFRREQLYEWKSPKRSNGIKLKDLRKLIEITKIDEKEFEQFNEFFVRYGKNIRIPTYLNENVCYLAGLIAGDGDISSTNSVGIRLHSIDEKLLLKAKQILKKEFNLESKISKSKDRVPCLRFSSIILRDIFYALGIPSGKKSHKIDLTNTLLLSGDKNITAFLRGLYDSDGCVSIPKNGSESIGFSTCSKILAQKMQLILEIHGIIAKLRIRERNKEYVTNKRKIKSKKVQYHLEIRGVENFKLFKEKISFDKEDKRKKLNLICKDVKSNPNVGILPKRIHKEFYWDEINKITKIKCNDKWVYDFTVNDGHSFFANGILVHNTASAERDNLSDGGWVLKAGALVLASGGLAAIDEFDKIDDADRAALHEAMESQKVSVAKAGIVATFKSKTAIIAAANPKYGRFNKNMYPADQFNIPSTLLSRFDLIFPMFDDIDEDKDRMLATHILNSHANIDNPTQNQEELMEVDFIRKYISYARKYVLPRLTPEAMTLISDYYIQMRNLGKKQGSIPITARQIEGLVRMAEASAKARLCEHVEAQDAERSIRLFDYSLRLIAMDATTGKLDIDIITTGQPKARREKFMTVINIIKELSEKVDLISLDDIKSKAREYEIDETEIQSIVEKLREKGEIYSPKNGFYKITDRK